jgi:hypothetical protein
MKREKTKGLKVMESIKSKRSFFFQVSKKACIQYVIITIPKEQKHPKTIDFWST